MSYEWTEATLGDFITFKNGKTSPERDDSEKLPVYGSNGVIGYSNSSNAPGNSLIIGRVGSYCGSVYHSFEECWVTDNAIMGLPKTAGESEFWYFFLLSLNLNSYRSGSGQPLINQTILKSIPIRVPAKKEIRAEIGKKAMLFNHKIEANTQTNQTLEQIAQALFKNWFVDFDPVKAKISVLKAGGTAKEAELAAMSMIAAKSSEQLAELKQSKPDAHDQLARTAALFPSAMQESELGKIPEGWLPQKLENLVELAYGKALKKQLRVPGNIPVYGSGGVGGYHSTPLISGPGVIVGRKGTVGSIFWEERDFFPIDTVFYIKPKQGTSLIFTYYLLQTLGLEDMNTDAAVPGLNRNNVYRLEIPSYPQEIMDAFSSQTQNLRNLSSEHIFQNQTLSSMRDSLLPELLSGKIGVA